MAAKTKLTIYEIKERIEKAFPELVIGWNDTGQPNIISTEHYRVVAYTYHQKWILTPFISDYSRYIASFISILDKWDGRWS
ncbi:hypothetical protein [Enterococcus sp. HY326]|uniref:hypothetical protein n=1 Tax=Enterococcus sp. HY326 TaxID=2971265 RepID=UPI00223F4877|nr:hypothetical protein [Enterococcus sp. HY326]